MAKVELGKRKREFECKWCNKGFSKETTLASHMCTKKKRYAEKDTTGARIGLTVFQKFYDLTMNSKKPKTSEDFVKSTYYVDFVKFGRHIADLKPINTERFIEFVIKNGVKLKDWTKDYVYETYIEDLMFREPASAGLERTVVNMSKWCETHNTQLSDFFVELSTNEATHLIKTGKISPWVLYLSPTALTLLSNFNVEQYGMIESLIDPEKWKYKITKAPDDASFVKHVLKEAGL